MTHSTPSRRSSDLAGRAEQAMIPVCAVRWRPQEHIRSEGKTVLAQKQRSVHTRGCLWRRLLRCSWYRLRRAQPLGHDLRRQGLAEQITFKPVADRKSVV